ncbi:MAG: acetate--CoA ligase family protein [Devosia sp.]|nr:acetate--CoA ligase family protein [Devosia sp.]
MTRPTYRHSDLKRLLSPGSIAIVGASPKVGAFGQRVQENLRHFKGTVYPVNSRYTEVGGIACYPTLTALPEVPDCVVVTVPRDGVEGVIEECARLGVGGVIVFASGFAEMGGAQQLQEQARIVAIARGNGVRLVGPNCIGLVNWLCGAAATFMNPLEVKNQGAPAVGIVSQSGAMGFALSQAMEHGGAISHILTCGNSADVTVADYVSYLAEEPGCAAIACVFEGMDQPMQLIEAAQRARAAGKAVVVYKMATGAVGSAAAMTHTGSLSGSDQAYRAAFEHAGMVVVDQFEDLIETAAFFAKAGRSTASGVAVGSTSGGAAIIAADKAEAHGVELPQPAAATSAVLKALIPDYGSARNPYDFTGGVGLSDPQGFQICAEALLKDDAYAALVVPLSFSFEFLLQRIAGLDQLSVKHDKIVCIVWMAQWLEGPGAVEAERGHRIAMFRSMDLCFATLAKWHRWSRRAEPSLLEGRGTPAVTRARTRQTLAGSQALIIGEHGAKPLLADYGIPMVQERIAATFDECIEAANAFGYPVALKAHSPKIAHKTEAGVVRLDILDATQLRLAYGEVMANAMKFASAAEIRGVLVQPMMGRGVEIMVGGRIDPMFGPLVVVGLGGIFVELMRDTALALAPLDQAGAVSLLQQLKGFDLLQQGFRGMAPIDVQALAAIVCRVGDFLSDHRDLVAELDINPLICTQERIVGVDALIALQPRAPQLHSGREA